MHCLALTRRNHMQPRGRSSDSAPHRRLVDVTGRQVLGTGRGLVRGIASPARRAHLAWRATPPAGEPLCARRFIPTCDYQSAANSKLRVNARLGLAALVQVGMILSSARRRGSTSRQFGIDSQGCRGSSRPRLDGSAAVRAQRDGTRKIAHSTSADRRGRRFRQYTWRRKKQDGPDEWGHLLAVPSFALDGTL